MTVQSGQPVSPVQPSHPFLQYRNRPSKSIMGKPKRPRPQDHTSSGDGVVAGVGGMSGEPSEPHAHQPPSKRPKQPKMNNETNSGGGGRNNQKKGNKKRRNSGGGGGQNGGDNRPYDLMVKITRVELIDDYRHAPTTANLADDAKTSDIQESTTPNASTGPIDVDTDKHDASTKAHLAETKNKSVDVCASTDRPTDATQTTSTEASASPKAHPQRQPFIKIIKTKSAKFKPKFQHDNFDRNYKPLPDGDCGDGIPNPHSKEEVPDKFWAQRRRLFSRYDDGIRLDKESWYSVTPEAIADHIAKRMVEDCRKAVGADADTHKEGVVVLDAFCGCGGNAVAFAKLPPEEVALVVAIDVDKSKLEMAAHNASLYGIEPDRIVFIHADAVSAMKYGYDNGKCILSPQSTSKNGDDEVESPAATTAVAGKFRMGGLELLPPRIDVVFLSPPWGGMDYGHSGKQGYDVAKNIMLNPWESSASKEGSERGQSSCATAGNRDVVNGEELLQLAANVSARKNVAYFLPRNTNGISLGRAALKAGYRTCFEMEQNFLNGKFKTMTAYLSLQK